VTSSCEGVGDLDNVTEKQVLIESLGDRTEEVKLLQKKSPRILTTEEMNELVDEIDSTSNSNKNERFLNHEIFDILNGNP
jgi:hypothetical protein